MSISLNSMNMFSAFSQKFGAVGMLKSTQEKLERQQKTQSQVAFLENQKANLKDMECDSIEEIMRKLEMFHSYEDQIAAAKKQYNMEQMWHVMDEAEEQGEKIAKASEKYAPKTEEERKEEQVEEALGIEENKSGLLENVEELPEEIPAENVDELLNADEISDAEEISKAEEISNAEACAENIESGEKEIADAWQRANAEIADQREKLLAQMAEKPQK